MEQKMRKNRLYTVVPRLLQAIDNLTNWYTCFNRKRLKGAAGLGLEDTRMALDMLFLVLLTVVRAMAPFTPFLPEHINRLLQPLSASMCLDFRNTYLLRRKISLMP